VRGILILLLLIFPAALLAADTHRVIANGQVDFSAFKTFVVRQGYPTSRQPPSGNQGTKRTPDVDPKLTQAVRDALRSTLSSKGIKETLDSADLIVNFRIEIDSHPKEFPGQFSSGHAAFVAGIVVIDLTNAATDTIIWHGQYIDEEETSAMIEKHLPENVKKLLSEYPPKKK
jgi:hypothetical protein